MIRLVFSPDADADLEQIGDFIAKDYPDAAISFVERLRQRCRDLLQFPMSGRRREDLKPGYRSVTEGYYIILYHLPKENELLIVRVLHSKRDLGMALKD